MRVAESGSAGCRVWECGLQSLGMRVAESGCSMDWQGSLGLPLQGSYDARRSMTTGDWPHPKTTGSQAYSTLFK
jgi:hypothetical protein